jgi:hypothetical protein
MSLIAATDRYSRLARQEPPQRPGTLKSISVTVVRAQNRATFSLGAKLAVSMLENLEGCSKRDRELGSNLAALRERVLSWARNPYLRARGRRSGLEP